MSYFRYVTNNIATGKLLAISDKIYLTVTFKSVLVSKNRDKGNNRM